MRQTKAFPITAIKAVDTNIGTFEAVVSVFNNIDLHGDRILPGAFASSLERWRTTGDPIPVIFNHGWDDLANYLGTADPKDVRELMPGDPGLPEAIRDNGGLMVKGTIDTEEPEGRKALKLLKNRVIREFSFAYDILGEDRGEDGHNELSELDLIEVGPTLKGANPLTQLVAAKARAAGNTFDEQLDKVATLLETSRAEVAKALGIDGAKAVRAEIEGTIEQHLRALGAAAIDWARDTFGNELYWVFVEGTFPDHMVAYTELWDDPIDGGRYYELAYSVDGDDITISEATLLEVALELTPTSTKAGARFGQKEGRRNASADAARIQTIHDAVTELGAECDTAAAEPDGASSSPATPENPRPAVLAASLESELFTLDLSSEA